MHSPETIDLGAGPSVGVITRTKDRAVLLRRALESVRNQTWANWQLVVVNDGGETENVTWLVEQIFKGDPRVSVIHHQQSKGMEAASNAGIALLETDYAIIHDDDDSWAPEFLKTMVTVLSERQAQFPSIKGVVCRINNVFETVHGNEIEVEDVSEYTAGQGNSLTEGFLSLQKMLIRNQFPPIGFIFDLVEARKIGLFNESLPVLGDWDFHSRFLLKHDVWVHNEALAFYHHRRSATGSMGNTIYSGGSKHHLYSAKIRNELFRSAAGADGEHRASLALTSEIQEFVTNEINHLHWRFWQIENRVPPPPLSRKQQRKQARPQWRKDLSVWFRGFRQRVLKRQKVSQNDV